MIAKLAIFLFASGVCLAYPADDEQRPPQVAAEPTGPLGIPPQPLSQPPQEFQPPQAPGSSPNDFQPEGPGQDGPENDLKTDNTFWYRRRYYSPYYQRRLYYTPRSYTYSSYYTPYYYSYWNPYSWW